MLDETHAAVSRPALLVVVTDQVLVVRVRVRAQVPLDEVPRLVRREAEHDVDAVHVARVQADRVASLRRRVAELKEVVRHLRRSGHLARALKTEDEQVEDETVVLRTQDASAARSGKGGNRPRKYLEDERGELETADETVRVDVRHVLVGQDDVVLRSTVVRLNEEALVSHAARAFPPESPGSAPSCGP